MAKVSLEGQLKVQEAKIREAMAREKKRLALIQARQRKLDSQQRVRKWLEMGKLIDAWGLLNVDHDQLKAILEITQDMVLTQDHPARNGRSLTTLVLVGEDGLASGA